MIKIIDNVNDANKCDEMLTKLIQDEKQYDDSIDSNFEVNNFYSSTLNNEDKILFGYYLEDILIGYIYIYETYSNNNKGYFIDALYVEEEYRNKGYGRELINEAISYAEGHEGKFIDIKVLNANTIAKELYKSNGFNEFKVMLRKDINV